eukprot:1140006-Pelagomonas_calceolata.AAC.4
MLGRRGTRIQSAFQGAHRPVPNSQRARDKQNEQSVCQGHTVQTASKPGSLPSHDVTHSQRARGRDTDSVPGSVTYSQRTRERDMQSACQGA